MGTGVNQSLSGSVGMVGNHNHKNSHFFPKHQEEAFGNTNLKYKRGTCRQNLKKKRGTVLSSFLKLARPSGTKKGK